MERPPNRHCAVIDLGSNSARLVLMNYRPGYSYHLEDEIREIVRLREGMDNGLLSEAAMTRAFLTLRLFQRFCENIEGVSVIATATSAVREAANGPEFVERVQKKLGLSLRILSGEEEARYGVLGAMNSVAVNNGIVVDIGGGSAQISQVKNRKFVRGQALTLGALALTERFVKRDPIKKSELKKIQAEIDKQLDALTWLNPKAGPLVGLGGTIRSLARMEAARRNFPLQSINGFELGRESLDESIRVLRDLPLALRRRIPGLVRDRADIILPGALVIRSIMERMKVSRFVISECGLREGLFFEEFWKGRKEPLTPNLRNFSILNTARFYNYHAEHCEHVAHLSIRLFDQLAPLHGFGKWERSLLQAAALLHDIGMAVRYNDHHKYSQLLITGNGLPGYTPRETTLIALLARYHRKGTPSGGELAGMLETGDGARLLCLASLLRLSEYLERGRSGLVRDVTVQWNTKQLKIELHADESPVIELWDARRNAVDLMALSFARKVILSNARKIRKPKNAPRPKTSTRKK